MFALFILIPVFFLGYWLISTGKMQNLEKNKRFFLTLAWVGFPGGAILTASGLLITAHPAIETVNVFVAVGNVSFYIGQYLLSAGYLGVIVLVYLSKRWRSRLDLLSPLGRMALTNYIMQTAILCSIFYGYAGNYFGSISRAPQMLIVIGIILFQWLFSTYWLKYFRFGPLEWLWRSFTYWKIQPLVIK